LGNTLFLQKKYGAAEAAFRQAIALGLDYAPDYNNLGNALYAQKKLSGAIAQYRTAIALEPNYAQAYRGLGLALLELGQFHEALKATRQ
jgi:tetratricopeptide (TPR) repeat protein